MSTDLATTHDDGFEPLNRTHWPPDVVMTALSVLAAAGGSSGRASDQLRDHGHQIHPNVLRNWRSRYPNRYRHACNQVAPLVEQRTLHLHREIASQAAETVLKAINIESRRLDLGKVDNAARTARDLSTAAAIAVDKVHAITGRPKEIVEHRTVDDSLNRLERLGLVVDGTAQELKAAPEETDRSPLVPDRARSNARENPPSA